MLACEFGKHEVVAALLREDAHMRLELDVKNEYQYTALILAAEYGHLECVKLLVEAEAALDLDNKFGKTALIMAAENGKDAIVRLLCESGANVNALSKRGVSALMLAAVKGHFAVVKILTEHSADIRIENKDKVRWFVRFFALMDLSQASSICDT
jgi:ankyrin repeat protein